MKLFVHFAKQATATWDAEKLMMCNCAQNMLGMLIFTRDALNTGQVPNSRDEYYTFYTYIYIIRLGFIPTVKFWKIPSC